MVPLAAPFSRAQAVVNKSPAVAAHAGRNCPSGHDPGHEPGELLAPKIRNNERRGASYKKRIQDEIRVPRGSGCAWIQQVLFAVYDTVMKNDL